MKCLIISGGEFSKVKLKKTYDLIIACDKGYLYAKKLNIYPDIIIGDFDSAKMPKGAFSIIKFDSIKDDTDTALAVSYALRNGCKEIDIICALGNRVDHTYANIDLLKNIYDNNGKGCILSDDTKIVIIGPGKCKIVNDNNYNTLSLFTLTKRTKINYISGTKYDGTDIVIKEGTTKGVSNEFVKKNIELDVDSGLLLAIMCRI